MGEFINPADVPKVKFYTGDEAPCIGMGTFGSDRFTADQIAEAVAMGDDDLMEKFFSGEEFTDAELTRGVRIGVRNGEICPVYSGSATKYLKMHLMRES